MKTRRQIAKDIEEILPSYTTANERKMILKVIAYVTKEVKTAYIDGTIASNTVDMVVVSK